MSNKIFIIILVVVVLFMGMVGAGFFILWGKISTAIPQVQTTDAEDEWTEAAETKTIGPMLPLNTFIVNLADKNGKRYLRVTMNLELSGEEMKEEVVKKLL